MPLKYAGILNQTVNREGRALKSSNNEPHLPNVYKVNGTSLIAQTVKCLPTVQETRVWSLGRQDPLEKEMTTHSSILAWKIPWTEECGRLQSMGSQRIRHDWATSPSSIKFLVVNKCSLFFSTRMWSLSSRGGWCTLLKVTGGRGEGGESAVNLE